MRETRSDYKKTPSIADQPPSPRDAPRLDPVDEASRESFPASDAPAWTCRPNRNKPSPKP